MKPLAILLQTVLAVLVLAPSTCLFAGTIRALGYDTPAYIDFEFSEISAPAGQPRVQINLYRTGDFRQTTAIDFATVEGTAVEGKDYKGTGGTLIFQPGEGYKSISVDLLANETLDTNKDFQIKLTAPSTSNTLIMRDTAEISIQPAVRLQIARKADGRVLLSWDGDPNYIVEGSADPASGIWKPLGCAATAKGNHCEIVQAVDGALSAFRLRRP